MANATGMTVAKRGMHGHTVTPGTPVDRGGAALRRRRAARRPRHRRLPGRRRARARGLRARHRSTHPRQRHYLDLYKLGEGPLYCFYTPYHLCHFEVPTTIARAVLFGDATIAPLGAPQVEVVTIAKRDLRAGETIDALGGYHRLRRGRDRRRHRPRRPPADRRRGRLPAACAPVAKDAALTYADVELPAGPARRPPARRAGRALRSGEPGGVRRGCCPAQARHTAHAGRTRAATSSAMASEAVRPGLSMPKRFTRPGTPWVSGPSMAKSVAGPPAGWSFGRMPA